MLKNNNEKRKIKKTEKILISQYPVVPLLFWCDVTHSVHLILTVPLSPFCSRLRNFQLVIGMAYPP